MFRSHSLIALPVLLLPLYGAATALPQAPQSASPETVQNCCVPTKEVTLAGLKDKARPLLIFAPSVDNVEFQKQLQALGLLNPNRTAVEGMLAERDAVLVPVLEDEASSVIDSVFTSSLSAREAALARERFGLHRGEFKAVLIGKDGGAKKISAQPIALQTLLDTIDAMPMRQREIRDKSSGH